MVMSRRPSQLYIFTSSTRWEPYVNVLVEVTRQFPLKEVHFLCVTEHGYRAEVGDERAAKTQTSALDALHSLAEGVYQPSGLTSDSGKCDGCNRLESVDIGDGAQAYQACLEKLR